MKTSVEEFTYSGLVERICRKIKVDGMLRISYFPMVLYANNSSYIFGDEDIWVI